MHNLKTIGLTASLLCGFALFAQAESITNGGFEAGLSGWTTADFVGSDGTFFAQSGATSPLNAFPVPAPPQGTNAAMTDQGAGGAHILYQDFVVPANALTGAVSYCLFINSGDSFFTPTPPTLDWESTNRTGGLNLNQQARVDILTTSADPFSVAPGDVLQNLFQTNPGDPQVSGYTSMNTDLTTLLLAHKGETLRLRFTEVDNVSFFNFGVDKVSLAIVPEPSAMALSLSLIFAGSAGFGYARLRRRA